MTCGPFVSIPALLALAVLSLSCGAGADFSGQDASASARTLRRFRAPEASQAVAVDDRFFYAIGNTVIAKYDKTTGKAIAAWRAPAGSPIAHLNSGIIVAGELYCAHSNYPQTPMVSSIEVFDRERLVHLRSLPLPDGFGSATWIDRAGDGWWVTFANYAGRGGVPGKGPEATRLVHLSEAWQVRRAYAFPPPVVARWARMSSSGGAVASPGVFVTTGHDRPELYVVALPDAGDVMVLRAVVSIESEGQGIALDRTGRALYSVQRRTGEVLVSTLPESVLR